jgi:hypothetical protein
MTPEQFAYWLQGWTEMEPNEVPSPAQWAMIKAHLKTVFTKVTPNLNPPFSPVPSVPWPPITNPASPNTPYPFDNPFRPGPDIICSVANGYSGKGEFDAYC